VVAFACLGFRAKGFFVMSNTAPTAITLGTEPIRQGPVTVKLERVTCDYGRPYPPDGNGKNGGID
jgi:hypothetical protein